jgi:hypothetical protein
MKTLKKLTFAGLALIIIGLGGSSAHAMVPTLSISQTYGDSVSLSVWGDPNSNVILYYNQNYGSQNRYLGATDNTGRFTSTISTSNYGITPGASVYVIVNNQQSSYVNWPYSYNNYGGNFSLNVSNLSLTAGNSSTIYSNNNSPIFLSNNSNPSVVALSSNSGSGCTSAGPYNTITGQPCYYQSNNNSNNNSLTVTALAAGQSTLTICQNNSSYCSSVYVTVTGNNNQYYPPVQTPEVIECTLSRTLKYGMSGSDVRCLQEFLQSKGYLDYAPTSQFGPATLSAVQAFQSDNYLNPDGVVGRATQQRIFSY